MLTNTCKSMDSMESSVLTHWSNSKYILNPSDYIHCLHILSVRKEAQEETMEVRLLTNTCKWMDGMESSVYKSY